MDQPLEIILPEQKPALEWIRGHAVPKVSPRIRHAVLQGMLFGALHAWSAGRYIVGSEWRFRLAPPGQVRRPLVPDVAVIPREAIRNLTGRDFDWPPFGPLIVAEILSPGDQPAHLDNKRDVYFACGTLLMLVIDPLERTVDAYAHTGTMVRFTQDDTLTSCDFPDLQIPLRPVFAAIDFD